MKTLIAIIASCAILSGAAFAGCGKKINSLGTLTGYDKATKKLTMEPATKDKKGLTITAKTKIVDKDGKPTTIDKLVNQKDLLAISEHGKLDWVGPKAAAPKKKEKKDS